MREVKLMSDTEWLRTKYFRMLSIYKVVSAKDDIKGLSKVLLALEDFERTYYERYGLGDFCDLLEIAEQKGLLH